MRRVVVTGLGAVTPIGNSVKDTWSSIQAGKSGIGYIDRFDTSEFKVKIAAQVKDFKASDRIDKRDARKMALFTQYAVYSALEAIEDSGLDLDSLDKDRLSTIVGVGIGGFEVLEEAYEKLHTKGPSRIPPMLIPKLIANEAPGNIAIALGATGPSFAVTTACASGTDAIGQALMHIRHGQTDICVCGGTESTITQIGIGGFEVLQTLSTEFNETPEKASRPFDKDRDGFVMGEGAGILILEELEHALARGAKIYAEVAGYGMSCDANHLTSPHPEAEGAVKAMQWALKDAGLKPEAIDYINAHGTSTPVNDPIETLAIKKAFGDHAYKLKMSSTKSMTGHLIGAAGGVEAIISIKALEEGFYPPTINLEQADEACDLDYVANTGVKGEINAVLSNSLGFGGHNGVIIFKRYNNE
jgi:3-oxoacyl-[acyl-carrier-protein] synthase II